MEDSVRASVSGGSRLGIMGGTFDPIHYGHLVAAETARVEFKLDNVLFIPAGEPPHKIQRKITAAELRYRMVELAIKNNEKFHISAVEINRRGPSYTFDTLRQLHRVFPDQELYFITGTDAMKEILTWRKPEEIIKLAKIIGVSRPGYECSDLVEKISREYPLSSGRILLLEIPAMAISSTHIRASVASQKSIRYLVPEEVRRFIEEHSIYKL